MTENIKKVKETVVAFRLTPQEFAVLSKKFTDNPMVGVRSPSQLARKLALDWCAGRLKYSNERDQLLAPDVNAQPTATPQIEIPKTVEAYCSAATEATSEAAAPA